MTEPSVSPLVSILTPTYNANNSNYLQICLESILNQSYPHIQHVIADGGSTDGTLEILQHYSNLYPGRMKVISSPDNGVGERVSQCGELLGGWVRHCEGVCERPK